MKRYFYFFVLFPFLVFAQPKDVLLKGRVLDAASKPIEFATVGIVETNQAVYTDGGGNYTIALKNNVFASVTLQVRFVGKQIATRTINSASFQNAQIFNLADLSLTLDNVTVTAERKKSEASNSAIVFDRQAIEQVQAYSLADILNNLPGKVMSAPNLQNRQNITLRSAATTDNAVQQASNSMGVAIFVDGFRQSNDANMQTRNFGVRGITGGPISNSNDPGIGSPTYDTPYSGLDIRTIPADNIESIEVVSGVASAKYGELTDGAIIINRMAGKSKYAFNMRLNGNSTNYSLSKGYTLSPKAGALNFNVNVLNSVQDPRDRAKDYKRFNGGLMWTVKPGNLVRNTLSIDFSYKNDHAKVDPDDDRLQETISLERRFSISNRTGIKFDNKYIKNINVGLSFDKGYSNSYTQYYINNAPKGVADKDVTGIYEGYYIPGNYFAIDHVIGEPYNFSGNIDISNQFITGAVTHNLSIGSNLYLSGNNGQGIIADPNYPTRGLGSSMRSERPYSFDQQRNLFNTGIYLQDQTSVKIFGRILSTNIGVRYDLQNGAPSVQPRVNTSYQLSKHWSLRAAYGIATKSPSMAYRYPAPTYFDVPLLNLYNGKVNESVYLVYTRKIEHDYSDLKPSKSTQIELGASADYEIGSTSIYGYYKKNRNGFAEADQFLNFTLPVYTYTLVPGQKPVYTTTGETRLYSSLSDRVVSNNLLSDNYGIEWFVSSRRTKSLQTTFNMNTSVSYSRSNTRGYVIVSADESFKLADRKAWYGIYPGNKNSNLFVISKFTSDTHIPKLGFVVSLMADVYWLNQRKTLGKSAEPVAYIDRYGTTYPITNFDINNNDYGYLSLQQSTQTNIKEPPMVYGNLSLRLAKEIKKKLRVAIFAYNFLNLRPQYYNEATQTLTAYNNTVNVGGEVSIKF